MKTNVCFFFLCLTRTPSKLLPLITKPPLCRGGRKASFPCAGGSPKPPALPWEHRAERTRPPEQNMGFAPGARWLQARCRADLPGMFPLAGSLLLARGLNDISRNCCYLWLFFLFIWIIVKTARLSQILEQLLQWEAWQLIEDYTNCFELNLHFLELRDKSIFCLSSELPV